jgi:hypothetical protein
MLMARKPALAADGDRLGCPDPDLIRPPPPRVREAKPPSDYRTAERGLSMKRTICALGLATLLAGGLSSPAVRSLRVAPGERRPGERRPREPDRPEPGRRLVDAAGGTVVAGNPRFPGRRSSRSSATPSRSSSAPSRTALWVTQGSPASLNIDPRRRPRRRRSTSPARAAPCLGHLVRAERQLRRADEHLREPLQRRA